MGTKEERFYAALKDVFVGAKVEGESGYINLMRIKSRYFEKISSHLKKDVEEALKQFPGFKEDMFNQLYTFFHRYFSESGSIYFRYTPIHQNIYEKVYTDDKDVMLFWKTHMLYYVKTDRLFKNMEIESNGVKFFFDVSKLEHKKSNEKREIVYEFKDTKSNGTLVFNVYYSEKGKGINIDEIMKALKKKDIKISEDDLEEAFSIFKKQSEVDYFINKNAKEFLQEQFSIWLYQYIFTGESKWAEERIKQLQTLKDIAFKIVDFISQFEDELVKIWNKPKFVLNSNYVITMDKIAEKNTEILEKIIKHKNFEQQVKEWKELRIINKDFNKSRILENTLIGKKLKKEYSYMPIDTKHFKDLEIEIIDLFENLDESLDGWLIKSENYQALNTILPKFKGKIQTIFIDPPFNKEKDGDYFYSVKYKDSTWITILENRLELGKYFLRNLGSIFVRCDYNGNVFVRSLMNDIFGKESYGNEIVVNRFKRQLKELTKFNVATESLFYYVNGPKTVFNPVYRKRICTFCGKEADPDWRPMSSPGLRRPPERIILGKKYMPPKGRHWTFKQLTIDQMEKDGRIRINNDLNYVDIEGNRIKGLPEYLQTEETPIDSNWTDLKGYAFGATFPTQNAEELIERTIKITTNENERDIILDFFLGSGTTTAVAHKMKKRWVGIELAEHINSDALPRMKRVLGGDKSEISPQVDWKGGGFFKYYELEQYEDTLRKVKYEDSGFFENPNADPYNQYVFMKDLKMLDALNVDYKQNKVKVDLSKLYSNIDIAETLSNILGSGIKRIGPDYVELQNGEKINTKDLDHKLIKPLIWW